MCLVINRMFKTRQLARDFCKSPKVAKKNIVVYKILYVIQDEGKQTFYSPYQSTKYIKGELKKVKKFSFHIYNGQRWKVYIKKGLHTFTKRNVAINNLNCLRRCSIERMIIPKGVLYFKGDDYNIVSTQLYWPNKKA